MFLNITSIKYYFTLKIEIQIYATYSKNDSILLWTVKNQTFSTSE